MHVTYNIYLSLAKCFNIAAGWTELFLLFYVLKRSISP